MATKKKNPLHFFSRKFTFYVFIGIGAFVTEYASFFVVMSLTDSLLVAQTISFLLGLAVSFTGNRNLTFNTDQDYTHSRTSQLWRYVLLALFNLLLSNVLIHIVAMYTEPLVAKLVVMISVMLWNFVIFNKIIFRTK